MMFASLQEIAPGLQGQPVFCDMTGLKTLRRRPGTVVFAARWQGQAVVVKHWTGPGAIEAACDVTGELQRLGAHLTGPLHRVVDVLHHDPARAAVVMSRAPGGPLSDLLMAADAAERRALTQGAMAWLKTCAAPARGQGRFAPLFWVRRLAGLTPSALTPEDSDLSRAVIEDLRAKAPTLRGAVVDQAQAHSDFSVFNLHKDGPVITGFDLHRAAAAPVARTAARFLVSLRLDRCRRPGVMHWGADLAMLQGVSDADLLPGDQRQSLLPFFLGEYLLDRFWARYDDPAGRVARRDRLQNYLMTRQAACG